MFRRLAVTVSTCLALLTTATALPAQADTTTGAPVVVAHRGASAYAPENTIAAFELAAEMGADMFELDVQETKDHELVLMHDTTLTRTTDAEQVFPGSSPGTSATSPSPRSAAWTPVRGGPASTTASASPPSPRPCAR